MQSAKEKASNAAAATRAGMEKTKATVQEKVDKMKAHDRSEKAMAEQHKEERKQEAVMNKEMTKEQNAEARAAREHHAAAGERIISGNTPAGHETGGRIN